MKTAFPYYKSYGKSKRINMASQIEDNLSSEDKKILSDFWLSCSINSKNSKRNENIKRITLQICDFIEKPIMDLKDEDFLHIGKAIVNSKRTINGKNDVRMVVKRLGAWLEENKNKNFPSLKKIKFEVMEGSNKIRTKNDLITEEEFDKLLRATKNIMHKTLICLLWESAGRPEEILKLRWNDIDFKKKVVKLHSAKTGRYRSVPLDISIQHLNRLKEESEDKNTDLIFTSQKKGIMLSNPSFNYILRNLCKKAGVKKKISGYTFRHTRLTSLIKKLSAKTYEMFAGHSLETGMRTYAHLDIDDLSKEMKEKVFGIKELTEDERQKLEKEINELKKKQTKEMDSVKKELLAMKKNYEQLFSAIAMEEMEKYGQIGVISDVEMNPPIKINIKQRDF